MPFVWLNGDFIDESEASVSLRDTGLLHAAGVFTTMRSAGGKVFRLAHHLKRLRDSCDALFNPLQFKDEVLTTAVAELLARNGLSDARLRITVTRGQSQTDPVHGLRLQPNVFVTATEVEPYPPEYYERGMTIMLVDEQKLNPYDIQAGHKTLNYFSKLAALREANRRSAGEALWFNMHNYLQSGSISNVFVVKDGELFTPPTPQETRDSVNPESMPYPKSAVLPGITRAAVIELARDAGIDVRLCAINVDAILDADEVFITNSIMRVMPVCRIEREAIGSDKPGAISLDLSRRLGELIATGRESAERND
jgi:branched-subunit amino acid aminotransferase/4-amino-4-deoxychorismate lyase